MSDNLFDELKQFTGEDLGKVSPTALPKVTQQVHETIKQVEQHVQ